MGSAFVDAIGAADWTALGVANATAGGLFAGRGGGTGGEEEGEKNHFFHSLVFSTVAISGEDEGRGCGEGVSGFFFRRWGINGWKRGV